MKKFVSALLASVAVLTTATPAMAAQVADKPNQGTEGNTDPLVGKSFLKVTAGGDINPGTGVPYLPGKFTFAQAPDLDFGTINLNNVQTASVTNKLVNYTNSLSVNDQRPSQAKVTAMQKWFDDHPLVDIDGETGYYLTIKGDINPNTEEEYPVGTKVVVKTSDYNESKTAWKNYVYAAAAGYTISAKSTDLQNSASKMLHATSLTINGKETLNTDNTIVTVSDTEAQAMQGSIYDFFYGMLPGQTDTDSMVAEDASAYTSRTKPVLPTLTVRTSGLTSGTYTGSVTYTLTATGKSL